MCELTFKAEGGELPVVLRPHWPGGCSGVTIGPGYDMGLRSAADVASELVQAGIPPGLALQLSGGAGLIGPAAGTWARQHRALVITPEQSRAVFELVYPKYLAGAERIALAWGGQWAALPQAAHEVLADLCYRGDMAPRHRAKLEPSLRAGDAAAFTEAISDLEYWQSHCNLPRMRDGSPNQRFKDRAAWLKGAA